MRIASLGGPSFLFLLSLVALPARADTLVTSPPAGGTAVKADWLAAARADEIYFVMNKELSELRVHSLKDGKLYGQFRAISGLNQGDKEKEGDRKTPEGVYFVTQQIPKSRLVALHGPAAFELNYPNTFDRIHHRTGSGIWIHGVEKEDRLSKGTDTRGCVALSNTDILELGKLLHFGETPVVIVSQESAAMPVGLESNGGAYAKRLQDWATAWSSKDPEAYLAFYHDDFVSRKMNIEAWRQYKRRVAKQYKKIEVGLSDMRVLVHGKYAIAVFEQDYKSDRFHASSRKRVYLVGPPSEAKIISEEVTTERGNSLNGEDGLTLSSQ